MEGLAQKKTSVLGKRQIDLVKDSAKQPTKKHKQLDNVDLIPETLLLAFGNTNETKRPEILSKCCEVLDKNELFKCNCIMASWNSAAWELSLTNPEIKYGFLYTHDALLDLGFSAFSGGVDGNATMNKGSLGAKTYQQIVERE